EGLFDLRGVFGNHQPIELEIGCGKGGFLLGQSRANPGRDYFGIEWANKFYKYACDRMARWCIENVRVARTEGRHCVVHRLPAASLDGVHIYRPDPWPTKRHHKRRLISEEFVAAALRVLKPGARWRIQTDHADYFAEIERVTAGQALLEPVEFGDG